MSCADIIVDSCHIPACFLPVRQLANSHSQYCTTHGCLYATCYVQGQGLLGCCELHACRHEECYRPRARDDGISIFCDEHECKEDNCHDEASIPNGFCLTKNHACTADSCGDRRLDLTIPGEEIPTLCFPHLWNHMLTPAAPADHEQPGLDPSTHDDETGEEGSVDQQRDLEAQQNELAQRRAAIEQEREELDQQRADLAHQRNTLNQEREAVRTQSRDLQRGEQALAWRRLEEKLKPHERLLLHLWERKMHLEDRR